MDSLLQEHAYLVSLGVRALALVELGVPQDEMGREHLRLQEHAATCPDIIPFVLPVGEGAVSGFAAEPWVVDLLAWSYDQPVRQAHQIRGLLLGYSARAIAEHDGFHIVGDPSTLSMST